MKPKNHPLPRATEMAHRFVLERIRPGDRAIDATSGNGHDTLFLAKSVGPEGKVYAFDIQEQAIDATAAKTSGLPQVELFCLGHEEMDKVVSERVKTIMFNLGYLPKGDKTVITQTDTTLRALEAGIRLLDEGGLLSITLYEGHEGGQEEAEAVLTWAEGLDQADFYVARYQFLNLRNSPPSLLVIEKRH
ncbi:MAG: class I SAM-dependent methyltransferase [Verrucomicrobiales bacterium]|nr:class I SAM-dependent methyltransferase [Verrucomicrobiales bacterium]